MKKLSAQARIPMIGEWIDTRHGPAWVVSISDGKMHVSTGGSTAITYGQQQSIERTFELPLPGHPRNRAERRAR